MFEQDSLAVIYLGLMGFSVLLYSVLDGYDLGVGMMLPVNNEPHADLMIASIGPFWDANETWLVLAVGLLLIAFPQAHSLILKELYFATALMLVGLILRGVAFDFRAKARISHKQLWDKAFKYGSLLAALSQGFMLGLFVTGFDKSATGYLFAVISAIGVACAYCFIGCMWLVMKTEGKLQQKAIHYGKRVLIISFFGIAAVSLSNLWLYPEVYAKWFTWPSSIFLIPVPLISFILFVLTYLYLNFLEKTHHAMSGFPFIFAVIIFTLSLGGLGLSFYPYIVPQQLTIWQTVADESALNFLLYGTVVVVPTILAYTAYSHRVFWGKVQPLKYY